MKYQQGSTLIMVLIVLLLITLIGTMAMRESLLNLRLSTSTQVSNVLLNTSDAALFEMEDASKVRGRLNTQSVYGYFDAAENANDELVFCFNAKEARFFSMSRASVVGSTKRGSQGYCTENIFSTGRNAVISQVYVRKLNLAQAYAHSGSTLTAYAKGVSIGQQSFSSLKHVAVTTISILPSFANTANSKQISTCFQRSALRTATSNASNNVEECFKSLSIPYNMQYAEYAVGTSPGS